MLLMLVGADREENLGICHIAACAVAGGHKVQVIPFDDLSQSDGVLERIMRRNPQCIGLAIQFQHRAHEFLRLAARLRAAGYRGHITCGGQFPSMAWRDLLEGGFGVNSAVLHDGEETIIELLAALARNDSLAGVRGLAYRDSSGKAIRTPERAIIDDLDAMPLALRYRGHSRHFGVPFIPISGGRGCWGSCSYCSVTTCARDARAHGGGRLLRLRSPKNVATEMAVLWHAAGGAGIFCFHDENFLLPRPDDSLARVKEIRAWLDEFGVGKAAMVGKCRPECVTPDLARDLRQLGVIRLYVGIENASQHCSDNLNRRTSKEALDRALEACLEAGIFPCYNLLIFEPGATLEDIEQNVAFMRRHAAVPVNFCRAEAYHATPLYESLRSQDGLTGSYLGWDYRLGDDRTELLFRICAAVFRERNFGPRGVTNRSMGLGYAAKVLEVFHDERGGKRASLARRATDLTRALVLDKADLLAEAISIAKNADLGDRDRIERETALLGLRVAAGSKIWHKALDEIIEDMNVFAREALEPAEKHRPNRRLTQAVQAMTVAGCLVVGSSSCGGSVETQGPSSYDAQPPKDGGDASDAADEPQVYDALPFDSGTDAEDEPQVYDPLPYDGGSDTEDEPQVYDALPFDSGTDAEDEPQVYDPLPYDAGADAEDEPQVYDALPFDAGTDDESVDAGSTDPSPPQGPQAQVVDSWRDTSPRRSVRSKDLPFYRPPNISLSAEQVGDHVRVSVRGNTEQLGLRWEGDGEIVGDGMCVEWRPDSPQDQICVAARTRGGVAIASLRAVDLVIGCRG